MKQLFKAYQLENIKSKRPKKWLLYLFTGAGMPIIYLFVFLFLDKNAFSDPKVPINFLDITPLLYSFTIMFFTMGISMLCAQVVGVEHKNNTWTLIETQPLPKWSIYFAKFLKILVGNVYMLLTFFISAYVVFFILYNAMHLQNTSYYIQIEWRESLQLFINIFLTSTSFTALLFVINVLSSRTNIISTVAIISILAYTMATALQVYIPTLLPIEALNRVAKANSQIGEWISFYSRSNVVMAVFILILGLMLYYYKNHRKSVFSTSKIMVQFLSVLAIGTILASWMDKPRLQQSSGKTILAGTFTSDVPVKHLAIVNSHKELIAVLDIEGKNNFNFQLDTLPLPMQHYGLYLMDERIEISNGKEYASFFMTNGDSIHVDIIFNNNYTKAKLSGDRMAERGMNPKILSSSLQKLYESLNWNYYVDNGVEVFIKALKQAQEDELNAIKRYVNIDGFSLPNDVITYRNDKLKILLLSLWSKYKVQFLKANDGSVIPSYIAQLQSEIKYDDINLLMEDAYLDILFEHYSNGNNNIKAIDKVAIAKKVTQPTVREALMNNALTAILESTTLADTTVLKLVEDNMSEVKQYKYLFNLNPLYAKRLAKTNTDALPEYVFTDAYNKEQSLPQFLGSYVLIDVWATHCPACLQEAPNFEDFADKYANKNIKFLTISIDKNIEKWKWHTSKNKNLTNWLAVGNHPFVNHFGINTIPRFILISPQGVPLEVDMPFPSQDAFEQILNMHIK
jgi:thiol-disulfide isomerase/thioredoxin